VARPTTHHLTVSKAKGFIHSFNTKHGRAPTVPELTEALGLSSTRRGQELMTAMVDEGFLEVIRPAIAGRVHAVYGLMEDVSSDG
jgi:SOS-response transcriptional repressor LexA